MILGVIIQQPTDILDYDVGYDKWFGNDHVDALQDISVNIIPSDGTLDANAQLSGPEIIKVWIQGGQDGEQYTVELTATTIAGRSKQNELIVRIQDYQ